MKHKQTKCLNPYLNMHSNVSAPPFMLRVERKCEQAHIPHTLTLLEGAAYNKCPFHAFVVGNRKEILIEYW